MQSEVNEIARQKIRELGDDPDSYTIEIKEEVNIWRVIFLPQDRRIRGGGYEVIIDKGTQQVKELKRYQ